MITKPSRSTFRGSWEKLNRTWPPAKRSHNLLPLCPPLCRILCRCLCRPPGNSTKWATKCSFPWDLGFGIWDFSHHPPMSADPPSPPALPSLTLRVSRARHDLHNSIGHILGFSEMLLDEVQEPGQEKL